MTEPVTILLNQFYEYERAKAKSIESYEKKLIDEAVHNTHIRNLIPKLSELSKSIRILIKCQTK